MTCICQESKRNYLTSIKDILCGFLDIFRKYLSSSWDYILTVITNMFRSEAGNALSREQGAYKY